MKNIMFESLDDLIKQSGSLSDTQFKHLVCSFSTDVRLQNIKNSEMFESGFDYLGSDCSGGYAFFSNKEQADETCNRIRAYFERSRPIDGEFCLVFEHNGCYAVILYDDYIQPVDIDQIVMDGVLYTSFGAWADDIALNYILDEDEECEYWINVGNDKYDQSKHSNLREHAQSLVAHIFIN